jgi:hypothetical protein
MSETLRTPPPRASTFGRVAREYKLDKRQIVYARSAGVRNEAEFYSFLLANTDLGIQGVFDTPDLTERLMRNNAVTLLLQNSEASASIESLSFGAAAPADVPFQICDRAPELTDQDFDRLASMEAGPMASEATTTVSTCGPWPVRNQRDRGTCVSFATTALYELYRCVKEAEWEDLSEQFLYWSVKHHNLDGIPHQDGTWYEFAAQALARFGTCSESVWPYDGRASVSVSHDPPPAGAPAKAAALKTAVPKATDYPSTTGKAATLLTKLRNHNGVGIALPVFSSPDRSTHNWATTAARTYGFVQNPMPGWVADGGHAVCCVGFATDPDEPLGGYFVIRNSWGTGWGRGLPDPSYAGPEPGYGQVSASYVDRYLWEDCVF